ncbi:hypothetical protein GW915_10780 [bacterium]|nr:hypothetical protein [bacterium]
MPAKMGLPSASQKDLKVVVMATIPKDEAGNSVVDIYIRLPSAEKYICWVQKGDKFTATQREKLLKHSDPRIYCPVDQWNNRHKFLKLNDSKGPKIGAETQQVITDLFAELLTDDGDHTGASDKLIEISRTIATEIVADLEAFEKSILEEFKDITRLEDSYAIRSLAILFALALGFNSKTAITDITSSTLFMDSPLLDFTQEELDDYFRAPESMSPAFIDAYRKHPAKAHYFASQKVKRFTEQGLLMILNHHELHNGKGFPRNSQTRSLPDLVRILSYAVDIYETMKSAELNEAPINLSQALCLIYDVKQEAHLRRHQTGMMDKILSYLNVSEDDYKKAG